MRTDKNGNIRTLEEDIQYIWKKHGLKVIKERVIGDEWIIKAVRFDVNQEDSEMKK